MDSKAGGLEPCQVVHGTEVGEMVHFEFLHVRTTTGPLGSGQTGVGAKTFSHLLDSVEDISGYVWL